MARARNIKPGFFKNYELADMGPYAQILFAGLWCLADREGRLEDKPRLIKAEIFPYYDCDVNGELTKLERLGLVVRYEVDGVGVIEVCNFKKHQTPHNTEKASTLPAATTEKPIKSTVCDDNDGFTVDSRKSNGGKTPDSLIPDSLIPDSLIGAPQAAKRPTRKCPTDFEVTPELTDWALTECPGVDIATASAMFRDHTFKTAYTDWAGAWRNWVRRDFQSLKKREALPAWREQQRAETQKAVPRIALGAVNPNTFFTELGATNVTALKLG